MSVVRPTRWGNPFTVAQAMETGFASNEKDARAFVVECFRDWLYKGALSEWWFANGREQWEWMREHIGNLADRDLACWCPPGEPCHADVLMGAAHVAAGNGVCV